MLILEKCGALGEWEPVGSFECDCGDPTHAMSDDEIAEVTEEMSRDESLPVGRYRVMLGEREVHRFTVGEKN